MRRTLLFCALLVVVALTQTSCTSKSRMEREIAARESKIADLESDLADLQSDLEERNKEITAKEEDITNRDAEIAQMQEEIDGLSSQIGESTQDVDQLNEDLQRVLGDLQEKEKLWLREKAGMSTITMPNAATFGSGSTELTAEGKAIIDTIWTVLVMYPERDILVEGHTDSIPIGPVLRERFASNWELSAARAVAVLQYVLSNHAAEAHRLAAVGYGEYQPIASNETEETRARNRRVIISVRPQSQE